VAFRVGSALYYPLNDHLGGTNITTDSSGAVISQLMYKAFGETRYASGTTPTTFHYTGQREAAEIGLYFYGARFYDAWLGRFVQADTVVPDIGNPIAWDGYAYSFNNPVSNTDPTGHRPDDGCRNEAEGCERDLAEENYEREREYNLSCQNGTGTNCPKHGEIAAFVVGGVVGAAVGAVVMGAVASSVATTTAVATTASVAETANTVCGGDMCASEAQDAIQGVEDLAPVAETITQNGNLLLRYIHPNNILSDGSVSSLAFRDPNMSVFDEGLGATPEMVLNTLSKGSGQGAVYGLDPAAVKNVAGVVSIEPELGQTGNSVLDFAHQVVNNIGTKAVARSLRDIAQFIIGNGP
jgi:RHS repeat-associated protein